MRREDQVQRAIVAYLEAVVPNVFVFAIPNAAKRERNGKAGNAVPGLRRGMPDLCFLVDGRAYFFEVKTPKDGWRLSQVQIALHEELYAHGVDVEVVCSIEDVRSDLRYWGIKTREAAA